MQSMKCVITCILSSIYVYRVCEIRTQRGREEGGRAGGRKRGEREKGGRAGESKRMREREREVT